jgi:3-methylfumaryl-CoA hydratase
MHDDQLREWIGRSERRSEILDAGPTTRLAATLSRDERPSAGDALPPLRHWLHFLPVHPPAALGADGAVRSNDFLPPIGLPRRMWAGSRLHWHRPLLAGSEVARETTIVDIVAKQGRSGRLVFLTQRHSYRDAAGVAMTEDQDAVYRDHAQPGAAPAEPPGAPLDPEWSRMVVTDEVLLFRYSALTFNAHRIHYDLPYATRVEGYPGLLVHGPLVATLMLDHLRDRLPAGAAIARFEFRAMHPVIHTAGVTLCAAPGSRPGEYRVWARDAAHLLCMEGRAEFT